MRHSAALAVLLLATPLWFAPARVHASPLPAASFTAADGTQSFSGTTSGSGPLFGGDVSFVSLPAPSASISTSAGLGQASTVSAEIFYYFEIVGPSDGIPVPISVAATVGYSEAGAKLTGTPSTFFNVFASVTVLPSYDPSALVHGGTSLGVGCETGFTCTVTSLSGTLSANIISGAVNAMQVSAFGAIDNSLVNANTSVSAIADPVISFAPGFDATGYSIILSEGIGNSPAVPEPATLALLLTGAGAAGLVRRRRARLQG